MWGFYPYNNRMNINYTAVIFKHMLAICIKDFTFQLNALVGLKSKKFITHSIIKTLMF